MAEWVGGSEYFRSACGAVARGLCAGCGLRAAGLRAWVHSQSQLGDVPGSQTFVIGDFPRKFIPQIHPLLRFRLGMGKI